MKRIIFLLVTVVSVMLSACGGDDEPNEKFENKALTCGQTFTIPTGKNTDWESSNDLIATVEGNIVTAVRVGEAVISSNKGSFKVTVTSTLNVFTEPCLQWGSAKSTVKTYMSKVNTVSVSEDTDEALTYKGSGKALAYTYQFDAGKLKSSGVGLNGNYVDVEEMAKFMLERYVPVKVDEDNYSFYFVSPDAGTGALMQLTTVGYTVAYLVVYLPLDRSRSDVEIEGLFKDYLSTPAVDAGNIFQRLKDSL